MAEPTDQRELTRSAADILSGHFEQEVEVGQLTCLIEPERRNRLWRLRVETVGEGVPTHVDIKQRSPDSYNPQTPLNQAPENFSTTGQGLLFSSK